MGEFRPNRPFHTFLLEDDSYGLHCIHFSAYTRNGSGTGGKAICFLQFYVCILIPSFYLR